MPWSIALHLFKLRWFDFKDSAQVLTGIVDYIVLSVTVHAAEGREHHIW